MFFLNYFLSNARVTLRLMTIKKKQRQTRFTLSYEHYGGFYNIIRIYYLCFFERTQCFAQKKKKQGYYSTHTCNYFILLNRRRNAALFRFWSIRIYPVNVFFELV